MSEKGEDQNENGEEGGALKRVVNSAADGLIENLSSIAGSVISVGEKRVQDFSLQVFAENIDRMARDRSTLNAGDVELPGGFGGKVVMSPLIKAMLRACALAPGNLGGSGCTWVVCAPTDQGKSLAAQFLMHGNHNLRPKRSLKIDATNMSNFPMEVAAILKCSAAESCLAQFLRVSLKNTAPITDSGEGKGAKSAAIATEFVGSFFCNPGNAIAPGTNMTMADTEKQSALRLGRDGTEPSPILIIDQFDRSSKENKDFARTLIREAAAGGIVAFIITKEEEWASELVQLNGGTKCKPLPTNVDNQGYDGTKRFVGPPQWNSLFWPVENLRDLVRFFCEKYSLDPIQAISDNAKITPGEAITTVLGLEIEMRLAAGSS
jgi:hypothetical protein